VIGQDSGDVYALLTVGYNFDGAQSPVVIRQGDPVAAVPVLSVPNFYGAHGHDPSIPEMSAVFFAAGPDIRAGRLTRARNIDVAPTVARLLDVELGPTVDGTALPVRIGRKVTQDLIDRLSALLPTSDVQDDREIEKAIGRLQESLSDRYWDSDALLGSKGKHVFDAHEAAVRILARVGGQAAAVRKAIVTLSDDVAAAAVDAALGVTADERRVSRALDALAKARAATAAGRLGDAINHYLRAWDDARRVIESAS
jgi:hypothetical protein